MGVAKGMIKGFIFMFFGVLGYVVAPLWALDLLQQVLLRVGVFYPFSPVPIVLLGVPAAGALFFMGLFRGECVGHGLAGVARSLLTALWTASFPGLLLVNTSYPLTFLARGIELSAVFDVKGVIMLLAYVVAATSLVYVAETLIGLRKKEYLVYA